MLRETVAIHGVNRVNKNVYVDDDFSSFGEGDTTTEQVVGLTELIKKGGFHLMRSMSNHLGILKVLPTNEQPRKVRGRMVFSRPTERTTGVQWGAGTDEFVLRLNNLLTEREIIMSPIFAILFGSFPGDCLRESCCYIDRAESWLRGRMDLE